MSLRLGEIDISKKVVKPQMYLCKPNKEIISKISEAYEAYYNPKLGALNELRFKLPISIEKHHVMTRNKNADLIKGRYLIKMVLGNAVEYFIINNLEKVSNGEEFIELKALSLGFELNDKIIRDLEVQSQNATSLLGYALKDTIWSIGYVDSDFDLKYRGLDISSNTVLEVVFDIAKTYNAIVVWDTLERKINLHKPNLIGDYKGFTVKYGKYLEKLNQEDNSEEVVTRLKLYGKEDLTIREINPTGTNYIEDFSYFMAPYEEKRDYFNLTPTTDAILSSWNKISGNWTTGASDSLSLSQINSAYSKIISPTEPKRKNYKLTGSFKMASGIGVGKVGYVFRYIDENNYYSVQWTKGFRNPKLQEMNAKYEALAKERDELFGDVGEAKSDIFMLEVKEKVLADDHTVLTSLIGEYEALIIIEQSNGRNTTELERELAKLRTKFTVVVSEIPTNKTNIATRKADLINFEQNLADKKAEITLLDIDIEVEKLEKVIDKLQVFKVEDGVTSVIGESDAVEGWDADVTYLISVEVHREAINVWIDEHLVLSCFDNSFSSGAFGFIGYEQIFSVSDVEVQYKDYEVISHSEFMTDDLCHYLLEYSDKLEVLKEEFERILSRKEVYDAELYTKKSELHELDTQLKILLDERDVINTKIAQIADQINQADNAFQETGVLSGDLNSLENSLKVKLMQIVSKENDVTLKENEILVVEVNVGIEQDLMSKLAVKLNVDNSFRPDLLDERNQYIIEKEWSDQNIEDPKDLLKEGIKIFDELKQLKINLTVGIVNFLSMITEQVNWDKLVLGDTFKVEHDRLKTSMTAKLTEAEYNFDEGTINIKISNILDTNSDEFLDMIYGSHQSSTTVNLDKWKWDVSMENKGSINDIINNVWDANKQAIKGAKNQVVELSDRGLIIRDPYDPNNYLVGINSLLAITNDGGKTWKHAITSTGIVGERIYGKVIMGVNLAIEDEHGIVKWQGSKGEIFDRNGKLVMKLGLVSEPPETSGDCFGLISFNEITRVKLTDCEGFVIERKDGVDWEKVMWANTDGTLYTHDLVAQNIKIVNDIGKTILDAENNYLDIGEFQQIVMDGKLTTLEKMQLIKELNNIHSDYKLLLKQAGEYVRVHRDDVISVDGQATTYIDEEGNAQAKLPSTPSTKDKYSTTPLTNSYQGLINYMTQFVKITDKGFGATSLVIDVSDPMTESTSEIDDRALFIQMFKNYYDEAIKLRQSIVDVLYYSGINMGEYHNSMVMGEFGLIILRNDGKYRAYLNATNGLALQKWENNKWVNKLYASIGGHPDYADGTLIAEDLVAKRLRIETKEGKILLDADSLNFDFTVLDAIVYDDIIMSPEKSTLLIQFASITEQKNKLKEQISRYANTIYSDRQSSYFGLDDARSRLLQSEIELDASYDMLKAKLDIVFMDMNLKTVISTDLDMSKEAFRALFTAFYSKYELVRSRLEDFLERSSVQLGRDYNNTLIDAVDGITVTRNNMMTRTRMNATQGISIARNDGSYSSPSWKDVFYVNASGNLYAVDITTHGLKIVDGTLGEKIVFDHNNGITIYGNRGEVIRLNANEGIAIEVNSDRKFWIGTDGRLYAKDITTHGLKIVDGNLGEKIIFHENDGITINGNAGQQIRLNANEGIAIDVNNDKRFWIGTDGSLYAKKLIVMDDLSAPIEVDGSFISDLTVNKLLTLNSNSPQDVVHIQDNYIKLKTGYSGEGSDTTKFMLHFNGSGTSAYPEMIWGAESGGEVGKLYKSNDKFAFEYAPPNFQSKFWMNETDTDGDGQAMLLKTTGGIRLDAQKKVVMRTGENEYVRVVKGEDVALKFGEATVMIKTGELLLQLNSSNYIKITSSGIEIKGTKIDLN